MKNFKFLLSLPFLTVMLSPVAAHAVAAPAAPTEGGDVVIGGVGGTIRIVLSKPGHFQTEGDVGVQFYQPVNAQGVYDKEVNPFNNKPSPYLGGSVFGSDNGAANTQQEFDAGVQFETGVYNDPLGKIGFSAFITKGDVYVNARVWNGKTWDGKPIDPKDCGLTMNGGFPNGDMMAQSNIGTDLTRGGYAGHLRFKIEPATDTDSGGICMSVSNFMSTDGKVIVPDEFFYWNRERNPLNDVTVRAGYELDSKNNPLPDPSDPTGKTLKKPHNLAPWGPDLNFSLSTDAKQVALTRVKHESAMTRTNTKRTNAQGKVTENLDGFKLDGSQTIISWSNCKIDHPGKTYGSWTQADTYLTYASNGIGGFSKTTGFNAPANGKGAISFDRRINNNTAKSAISQTIVQYMTDEQQNTLLRQGVVNGGRYATETVTINLKTATEPQGQPLEWAKP